MKNLPLSIQRIYTCSLVLILGVLFALSPRFVHAESEVTLQVFMMEGLVFETYPEFEYIDFTSEDLIQTIQIDTQNYEEINLETVSFVQAEIGILTDSETGSVTVSQTPVTPTSSPMPTIIPIATLTPTPVATHTPTPSPTATPTSSPTPTPEVKSAAVFGEEIWDVIAKCESRNNWSIDTGNGYFGGLQFSQGAWESVGGSGNPAHATREEQIEKGKRLQEKRGWGVWGDCAKKLGLS